MPDRVLVAFDESPQAAAALRHALQTFPDSAFTVIHVNNPIEWMYADEMSAFYSETDYDRVQESAREVLSEAEAIAEEYGIEIETAIETGKPAAAVVDYADDHDVDHVVIGSHGRRGFERFLLGSVAETVARQSPTSVTIIRERVE